MDSLIVELRVDTPLKRPVFEVKWKLADVARRPVISGLKCSLVPTLALIVALFRGSCDRCPRALLTCLTVALIRVD